MKEFHPNNPMTGKEKCEYIFEIAKKYNAECILKGANTPEEFWNLSPTGELIHVYEAFQECCILEGWIPTVVLPEGTMSWEKINDSKEIE